MENADVFLDFFLALVGLLPAGEVNFLILVVCINLSVLNKRYKNQLPAGVSWVGTLVIFLCKSLSDLALF